MTDHIQIDQSNGVLTLVMNRPDKKNALTDAMYKALADAIEASNDDTGVRAILIRGEGDLFTSGNDIGEFAVVASGGEASRNVGRFLHAIATATKPLIAAVQGRAVGVGATMLLHCDHVVLADDAQLTTPFVSLALVPEAASSVLLTRRIGHVRAFSMFALGEPVGAHDAMVWGLANSVVPLAALQETARAVAERLARQPLGALVATKRLMRDTDAITAQMEVEGKLFLERLSTAEAREAFTAFAQRRAPDFSGLA